MLRIAVIGAGRIGQVHAAAVAAHPRARLVAVADPVAEAAERLAATHGVRAATTVGDVLGEDVDAVVVGSPTDHHVDQVVAAVAAGKAVLCEKPVASTLARVDECLAAVAGCEHRVMVGFNRRFDPNFRAVRRQIDDGVIGEVEMVTIISRDPGPPPLEYMARSGGLLRDMTIHDFDMARFLLGEEPSEVSAVGAVLVDPEIAGVPDIDSVAVTLRTPSGRLCQISNSRRAAYGYDQRIEVHGSKGMARAENIHESTAEVATAGGYLRPPLMNFFLERYMPAYGAEVAAFVDAISAGTTPSPSGDDGLRALLLADAASESLRTGRLVEVGDLDKP